MKPKLEVGQAVKVNKPHSWADGMSFVVVQLDATSSDNIRGCLIRGNGCVTVIEPEFLELATLEEAKA